MAINPVMLQGIHTKDVHKMINNSEWLNTCYCRHLCLIPFAGCTMNLNYFWKQKKSVCVCVGGGGVLATKGWTKPLCIHTVCHRHCIWMNYPCISCSFRKWLGCPKEFRSDSYSVYVTLAVCSLWWSVVYSATCTPMYVLKDSHWFEEQL